MSSSLTTSIPLRRGAVRDAIIDRLERSLGKHAATATHRDLYDALSIAVREELAERWVATQPRTMPTSPMSW